MHALHLIRQSLVCALAAFAVGLAVPAAGADREGAAAFIHDLARQTVSVAADRSMAAEARAEKLRLLLDESFDGDAISRFVLGQHWRTASAAEKAEFVALFREFTARSYARRFDSYKGETLTILGSRDRGEHAGSRKVLVLSQLTRADGSKVKVDWRVRLAADGWRIYDVVVEGVSLVLTQRSEFASIIQQSGGRIDGLLRQLRRRTAGFAAEGAAG